MATTMTTDDTPKVNEFAAATARAELRRRGYSDGEIDGMVKKRTGWRNATRT